ncbi:MAG TPA: glyoxalase superfamily protein [Candidatus Sulfotelmatobacter sp.]|nr:glyoxalase superfamily protein [Candidatus Sulfotelmatobacter sp.]
MAKLSRIAPEIPVSNLQDSVDYYQRILGFQLTMETPARDYAIVERDGIAIHLFQDNTRPLSPVGVHIFTDQLEDLQTELQGRGASLSQGIVRKPWGNRDFRVRDCSGNEIKFTEPLAH